jgi:hypothetical protein
MADIYLPTLHTFAMDNIFTGSCGLLRFRIVPNVVKKTPKEVDMEASSITAEFWHGEYCYELSEMEGKQDFPMTPEGRESLKAWLEANV